MTSNNNNINRFRVNLTIKCKVKHINKERTEDKEIRETITQRFGHSVHPAHAQDHPYMGHMY